MRETTFLKQNEQKWKEFERILHNQVGKQKPDVLADLFVELTDDLSFAKTHYPESNTVKYLNGLAATVHQAIYRNKKQKPQRFLNYWTYEVPLLLSRSFRSMGLAFVLFLVGASIGWVSALSDSSFLSTILGDEYVNMTKDNIANGRPMDVYGSASEQDSFFSITFNNIRVSFFAFIAGLLFSAGTAYLLFYNGLMLGAFHGFFAVSAAEAHRPMLLLESLQAVYMHGTLEITAIIIAGAAGFEMGNSLMFPGTFTRLQSLKEGAKKGMKIIVGLIPIFILAGFIEGFLTRYSQNAPVLAWMVIILSVLFVLYYFVIYPITLMDTDLKNAKN